MGAFDNSLALAGAIRRSKEHLRPPPDLLPSVWAEQNIRIPVGNAIPGLIRFENAPFQLEPLDMTINPDCYRITLMWAAQTGKTQVALCFQAYSICVRPRSQMMMQPSQGDLEIWLNSKFNPLVDANPVLQSRLSKPRARDGVNNNRMKSYPGGFFMFAWSGSPKTMRGRSAPNIVCDEPDGYEVTEEGHPVSLLSQRAASFPDWKLLEMCTPTIKNESHIEAAFLAGDQRRFYVPCPDCGHAQYLKWSNIIWDGRLSSDFDDYEKDLEHDDHKPETAAYVCEDCGTLWGDHRRGQAIINAVANDGGWIAAKTFKGHASYHAPEWLSPRRELARIVQSYLDKLKINDVRSFINVSAAETYEEQGESADVNELMKRAEEYAAPVPEGGLVLTAGVDMQQDRFEIEVVAWGEGEETWSIDYGVIWGDTLNDDTWEELFAFLSGAYRHESGMAMGISATCVDTGGNGGNTQKAYEMLRGKASRRIFAIKGVGGWGRPIVSSPQRKKSGKNSRKVDLFLVGTDEAKLTVMRRFAVKNPGAGYCHFPNDRDEDWYKQISSEQLKTRYQKGFAVREWHLKPKTRNEGLDCRVYALAAYKLARPSLKRAADLIAKYRERFAENKETPVTVAPSAAVENAVAQVAPVAKPKPARKKVVKRGWVSGY